MFSGVSEKLIEIFESIIQWLFDSLIEPFTGLGSLKDLVFGKVNEGDLAWGTFKASDLTDALNPLFYTMATLAGFFIVAFIVIYGIRISGAPLNPHRRSETIELLKDLLIVGIVFVNLPTFYDLLFSVNMGIVNLFNGAYESNLDSLNEKRSEEASGVIGYIFIQLVLLGLSLWANFYYLMRKVTLLIFMGMGPLMLAFWLHPRFKAVTASWLKELTGSIFIQAIHAFVFWTVATLSATSTGFVETVIVYIVFIPISEFIKRLLLMGGDMQGGLSKAGAMLGMGALAGMYGAVKGAVGDKSVMGAVKGAYQGTKDKIQNSGQENGEAKNTIGSLPGADNGTTPIGEKMLKAGDIFSKGGKAVMGMAGAVAGSPMGPVASIMGATGASAIGGAVGGLTGRVGASALQGIAARNQKGLEAFKNGGTGRNDEGFEENLANQLADRDTVSWANANKDAEMARLRELHPDASNEDLESKFSQIQAQKRAGFYKDAKANFANAKQQDGHFATGNQLVGTSAQAMANQWQNDNAQSFFDNYDQTNPQQAGETLEAYQARRLNALIDKKNQMAIAFSEKGNQVLAEMGAVDGGEPINKTEFQKRLGAAVNGMNGAGSVQNLTSAADQAISHVQGESAVNPNGKGNSLYLASRMAHAQTSTMGKQFVKDQMANGVTEDAANQMWAQQMPKVHQANISKFHSSAQAANRQTFANGFEGIRERAADIAIRSGGYLAASSGASGFIEGTRNVAGAVQTGMSAASSTLAVSTDYGKGGVLSHVKGFKLAATDGIRSSLTSFAEQNGGVGETQVQWQNVGGYAAGMLLGAKGYQLGKSAVAKFSPLRQPLQESIKAPSEVIQMAQTTTDEQGNQQITPGAIRQVITPNESYIEVRTKSGETKKVSRNGSGHSGLRQGDVIYQDLDVQGDSLVVSKPRGSESATYRIDSGGGRVPSTINIDSNPNELLGSPRVAPQHKLSSKAQVPSYSQSVDNGQFYVEDLKSHGMQNIQVVVEKDRQFVTAQKDGVTYRVSPVFAGDTRLDQTGSVNIPVSIKNNQLKATNPVDSSQVAVLSSIIEGDNSYTSYSNNPTTPYFSSENVAGLIASKAVIRATRGVKKRQELEQVRRKQGLLG